MGEGKATDVTKTKKKPGRPKSGARLKSFRMQPEVLTRFQNFCELVNMPQTKVLTNILTCYLNVAETDQKILLTVTEYLFNDGYPNFVALRTKFFDKNYLRGRYRAKLDENASDDDKMIAQFFDEIDKIIVEREKQTKKEILNSLHMTEDEYDALKRKMAHHPNMILVPKN